MRTTVSRALFVGTLVLFSLDSSAQAGAQLQRATMVYGVENNSASSTQLHRNTLDYRSTADLTLSQAIDHERLRTDISLNLDDEGLAAAFDRSGADCDGFIKDDGTYGTYGKVIERAFNEYDHLGNLLSDDAATKRGMGRVCPNFKSLQKEDRVRFWVWTFASIAWAESTCLPRARARGTTTTAVGLLQMEAGIKHRRWRGQLCAKFAEVASPGPNLLCGLEIMHGHFAGKYEGDSCSGANSQGLILKCSYWQKLRVTNSTITRLISLFPECGGRQHEI